MYVFTFPLKCVYFHKKNNFYKITAYHLKVKYKPICTHYRKIHTLTVKGNIYAQIDFAIENASFFTWYIIRV